MVRFVIFVCNNPVGSYVAAASWPHVALLEHCCNISIVLGPIYGVDRKRQVFFIHFSVSSNCDIIYSDFLASSFLSTVFLWLQQLSRDTMITAANGKAYPALDVFAHALRYFRQHALQELNDQTSTTLVDDDVRWVITVPAIWTPPARQFMRIAAIQVTQY